MKKILLTAFLIFVNTLICNAQQTLDALGQNNASVLYRNKGFDKKESKDVEGTPYLIKEFRPAEVSGISQKLMVRYNAETDLVEVQDDNQEFFPLIKKEPFSTINIVPFTNKLRLLTYKTKEGVINGYLTELLNDNNITLFRRDKIIIRMGKESTSSYSAASPSKYVKANNEYYYILKNEEALIMPKNKKELEQLFPSKKEKIELYLKINKHSLNNENSIIEMAKFISTL